MPRELRVGGGRFILKRKLGKGSFGDIYDGVVADTKEPIAIKLEPVAASHPQLRHEHNVYRRLLGMTGISKPSSVDEDKDNVDQSATDKDAPAVNPAVVGVPSVYWFGREGEFYVLVMDKLGTTLNHLLVHSKEHKFCLPTVYKLALQLIDRLEHVHRCGFVHRDVKPENFLMGSQPPPSSNVDANAKVKDSSGTVFIIDMGLCQDYIDPTTKEHIPFKDGLSMTGTARSLSLP